MINKQLAEFIKCLEGQRYYDAHESLELLWFPKRFEDCNEIRLLKGFINASVSLELAKRGKHEQSKKVWKNYLKYRTLLNKIDSPYINQYHNIAIYLDNIKVN